MYVYEIDTTYSDPEKNKTDVLHVTTHIVNVVLLLYMEKYTLQIHIHKHIN